MEAITLRHTNSIHFQLLSNHPSPEGRAALGTCKQNIPGGHEEESCESAPSGASLKLTG